ncbi:replication protein RepB [Nocardia cyriacigeorgica]|uniref:replication protein RepB n=1 Tax=Nocardia cyriacigeorgica TaxID=135487 RepID=UPI0018955B46|nr:replication protein RepB [Nocardia cyriacigeorgica]MBF6163056.1 replication protein RepB [Nocardia cyriacigeorgica]MBF6202024.1 replication protein RepB [Nocardia cyriacigeorgica]MBF6518540.1 replication protein RepB [Nocardia cyriacigeorgica]
MGAKNPVRRSKTARELAEQFGASPRTIQRLIAEPRADYESRAIEKRRRAQQMRSEGATYREIADELGIGVGSVAALLRTPVPAA